MKLQRELNSEEVSQLCSFAVRQYSPHKVRIVGRNASYLVERFLNQGVQAVTFNPAAAAGGEKLNQDDDLLIFLQSAFEAAGEECYQSVFDMTGLHENILVVFTLAYGPVLAPSLTQWLWNAGYSRNIEAEKWISDQVFVYAYEKESSDGRFLVEAYEAEILRLSQLNEKRRSLFQDYRDDIYREISASEQVIQSSSQTIRDLEHRWEAFNSSRTGRAIQFLQRVRQFVLPRGGKRERIIVRLFSVQRVIKTEGFGRFTRALPRRVMKRVRWQVANFKLRYSRPDAANQVLEIEPVQVRPECAPPDTPVDIIVCVHNALEDVRRCLDSVRSCTSHPYNLILVDDGSGPEIAAYLDSYARNDGHVLLRSDVATGYTRAANRGLHVSNAEYVVLLNSDTIVTPQWLERMLCCAESDPKIGVVGPLSNTASWQSVPKIEDNGDWAENRLPENLTVPEMGALVTASSERSYPEMPLLNGFCLMIKKQVLDQIGLLDEENFGAGYGEEDDFNLRARAAGWKLALADDAYIYHAQSKSYSNEKRKMLSERAGKLLAQKHGSSIIQEGVEFCHRGRILEGIRARVGAALDRHEAVQDGSKYQGRSILFILPVATPSGGANVIRTESLAMQKMGVQVEFFNLNANRERFGKAYPFLEIPTIYGEIGDIPRLASKYDAVVATYNPSVSWMEDIRQFDGRPVRGYYVQGFEPLMYPDRSDDYQRALESYGLFPDLVRFTKTGWTKRMVLENTGQNCHLVGPSLDIDLYRPRPAHEPEWPKRPIRIAAMVRPEAPYREPYKTMQLLKTAANHFGGLVEIVIFGTTHTDPDFLTMPRDFPWKLYGVLSQEQVANLLNQVDIFVDYSSHQAMGLTALEAMACGCAVIVPDNGGATSFARHKQNSIVVDTSSFDKVWNGLKLLVDDHQLRKMIQRNAIYDVCSYTPEQAALNVLNALFEDL